MANQRRKEAEEQGRHIPAFLIASITTKCNLHCKGCYARANHNCTDKEVRKEQLLMPDEWDRIFTQAEELGIAFALLEKCPNLIPILSIEGNQDKTDERRGEGVFDKLSENMKLLKKKSMLFGCSVTVQKSNLHEVLDDAFVQKMKDEGCKAVIYVEYVPADPDTEMLAPGEEERVYMAERLEVLRNDFPDMILLSFPGDEQAMGGCLAAGRGFFHINAYGGAEPCPFSAFSDCSLKEMSLSEALDSPLFSKLRNSGWMEETHVGGCTLFQKEEEVKKLLGGKR